jgi:methylmalonyl-CoA/ethylmalonyl-CoA epimerase
MITKVDHIGVAVRSLEERLPFWAEALGLPVTDIETVDSEKVKVAFLPTGESRVELLEPTDDASTIAGFVAKRGEGVHHLAFEVSDLRAVLDSLERHGVPVLGDGIRDGAEGRRVAFLHPKAAGGVLIELVEARATPRRTAPDIAPGRPVLVYLREPQEKHWGVLRRLDAAGVVVEGIDLASFDDWVAQIEQGEESVIGPSVVFIPMARLEKLLLDRSSGHLPSLAERFERRVGRRVQDVIAELDGD